MFLLDSAIGWVFGPYLQSWREKVVAVVVETFQLVKTEEKGAFGSNSYFLQRKQAVAATANCEGTCEGT